MSFAQQNYFKKKLSRSLKQNKAATAAAYTLEINVDDEIIILLENNG